MRTTINLEEDAWAYARERAMASGKSLGAVISEALREAARPRAGGIRLSDDGMPYIPAAVGGRLVTGEAVSRALDEEELKQHAFTRR